MSDNTVPEADYTHEDALGPHRTIAHRIAEKIRLHHHPVDNHGKPIGDRPTVEYDALGRAVRRIDTP